MQLPFKTAIYEFGEFRLDATERLLRRNEQHIGLALKEFEVLLFLIENAGRVIEKNEIIEAVWKNTFVEEGTLTQNISRLRKKLETDGAATKIIETLPKRGYRFLPIVTRREIVVPVAAAAFVVEEQTLARVRVAEPISSAASETPNDSQESSKMLPARIEESTLVKRAPNFALRIPRWFWFVIGVAAVAAASFAAYRVQSGKTAARVIVAAPRVAPFSGALGRENTPAFSPDGKQLVYAWNGGEKDDTDIYVRLIAGGEPLRLTDTTQTEQHPVFSPDGSRIAFVRAFADHGEVVTIPALGGTERRICRLFSGFGSISFAPDNKTIAVVDSEDSINNKNYAIYLVDIQTGERRRLNQPGDFAGETTPRFAPDNKSLAFVRVFADHNQDLFVASLDGGGKEPRRLTFDQKIIHCAAWSSSGDAVFFVSLRGSDQPNLWRVAAFGNAEPELVPTNGKNISNLAVAPDARTIAFVENAENLDIRRAATTTAGAADKKFVATTFNEYDPTFAPNGERVAFASTRTGKSEIWLADADGENLRQLTDFKASAAAPRFSPDSRQIAFAARADGNNDIYVVAAENAATRRVTSDAAEETLPVWSVDGAWIYFVSNKTGAKQIWRVAADGAGDPAQITIGGARQIIAAPDSDSIYFVKENDCALRRAAATGGGEEIVLASIAPQNLRSFAATRGGVYFAAAEKAENLEIRFYDFAAKRVRKIAAKLPANLRGDFAAAPDGTYFLYNLQNQNSSSIMLAELAR